MAKQATLTTITSTNNNAATLNANFSALNTALDNTISRDGSTPNTMSADFDMNSNDILNVATLNAAEFYLGGYLVANLGFFPSWSGDWTTATAYEAYDLVFYDDGTDQKLYRSTIDHTSGTFATDLAAGKWVVFNPYVIDQDAVDINGGTIDGTTIGGSAAGAGTFTSVSTGTLTATGNVDFNGNLLLDGVTNKATVLSDLGAQAQDPYLDDIAALSLVQGDLLYFNGTDIVRLGVGTAGQYLRVNGGATAPEWQSVAADTETFVIACSDETTALTTGTAKVTFRMPYAFTLTAVRASVTTAPTGANLVVDINEGGTSVLSTKLSIDATEKTSTTAATPAVISDSSLADDAEITIDIDQIGSTIAGAGLKVVLIGTKT